jgi:Tol biopolymer transport system component
LETVDWAVNGKGLFTSDAKENNSVLLYVDLQGNAEVLWEQAGEQEGNNDIYAVPSPDGRRLAMFGWTRNANMWMVENF